MRLPRLKYGPFRTWRELGAAQEAAAASTPGEPGEPLTAADEDRVEAEVRRLTAELRAKPSQEKEDRIGVEIASMPAGERDLVPAILLRIVAEEAASGRGGQPAEAAAAPEPDAS